MVLCLQLVWLFVSLLFIFDTRALLGLRLHLKVQYALVLDSCWALFMNLFIFKTGSYVVQISLNFPSFSLSLFSAGITVVYNQAWLCLILCKEKTKYLKVSKISSPQSNCNESSNYLLLVSWVLFLSLFSSLSGYFISFKNIYLTCISVLSSCISMTTCVHALCLRRSEEGIGAPEAVVTSVNYYVGTRNWTQAF